MPVEASITLFKPDSLTIVTNKVNSKLDQGRHSDLIRDHRDLIKLKIPIGHRRCPQERSHNTESFRLRKRWIKEQIAAVFEIAEIQAQGTAIYDGRSDRFLSVPPVGQPDVASATKAHAPIEFIDRLKFNIPFQLLRGDVNIPACGRSDRTEGLLMR
jgi:hypothetical protein